MERVGPLVDAGVTDFRAYVPVPSGYVAAVEYLRDIADAVHGAAG
jgi:hypothetical protein